MSSVALLLLSLSGAGARKLLRWEQQIMLHAGSGTTVLPAEVKAKMRVSAAELQEETGLSTAGLQHILAIAGNRYEYLTTADWSFELCASSTLCVHAAQKGSQVVRQTGIGLHGGQINLMNSLTSNYKSVFQMQV